MLSNHTHNLGRSPWNKGKRTGARGPYKRKTLTISEDHKAAISSKLKGRPKPKLVCPHCGKEGGASQIKQWHFDRCHSKKASSPKDWL